jgi:predicted O-methyltransferase YrrM
MLVEQQKLEAVVEIGTGQGGTLACWCQLAQPHAVVISVDLPGGDFGGGYNQEREEEIRRLLPRDGQTLHLIREDSHEPSTVETVRGCLRGKEIDLLFIDGDHTYEGVRQDFEAYAPLVKPSGLIVFHDILPHPFAPECKVDLFWQEVKDRYRSLELIAAPYTWGGIGILWQR